MTSLFQCRHPGGPGCENATPDGPCCGQLVPATANVNPSMFSCHLRDRLVALQKRELNDRTLTPGEAAALAEVLDAAFAFVATTTVFRQQRDSRDEFARLAYALLDVRDD